MKKPMMLKRKRCTRISQLVFLLKKLDKAFVEDNRKDVRNLVWRIKQFLKTTGRFTEEQGLIIELIAKIVHCRIITMKMKRLIKNL